MADPHWTSYVGMATGILGAITGISGAVMGFVSYRRSNIIKALDLRLELRKVINEIEIDLSKLTELLNKANQSRQRIAAATGQAGALQAWSRQLEQDKDNLKEMKERAPSSSEEYDGITPVQLVSRLIAAHRLQREIAQLIEKYNTSLSADDEERKRLRESVRR